MNTTALQILTAFTERVAATPCHWLDSDKNRGLDSNCIRWGGQPSCVPCKARAALEAAAKAPGLADDEVLASILYGHLGSHRDVKKVLRAIDAYQRGGG